MKNRVKWVKIAAIFTAIVGSAVAVAAFVRNKSKRLSEELDFDNSLYFDDDDSFMDDEILGEGDLENPVHTVEVESEAEAETEHSEPEEEAEVSDKVNEN